MARFGGTPLLLALLLPACGEEAPRRTTFPAGGVSAFELARAPAGLRHDVPLEEIVKGMPLADPKDAIRALFAPPFARVGQAVHLRDDDRVLVFAHGEDVRAYPIFLLDGHELVNDVVGGLAVLVTWCPLCGSGAVFRREVDGVVRTFGVSGYLWRSDVLLYDQQSESFWSQIDARAVVGPLTGARLTLLPSVVTSWAAFRAAWPTALVMRLEGVPLAAYERYRADPYASYRQTPDLFPGLAFHDDRLPRKAEVVGVWLDGHAHAWSLEHLRRARPAGDGPGAPDRWEVAGTVGERAVRIEYRPDGDRVEVLDPTTGARIPALRCYWFAWSLFHPDTSLTGAPVEK